ncbi:MAG: methionine adenosyltransferase [Bacteroidia bacterium]
MPYLFTSESVSEGHPDKVADQISDAILDAILFGDPEAKVACETFVTTGLVIVGGEVKTSTYIDVERIVRDVIRRIGYTKAEYKFEAESCGVMSTLHEQSPDIRRGVDRQDKYDQGAGDQGMMFGYATRETDNYMPLALDISHKLLLELAAIRKAGKEMTYLRPDSKSQVTIEYDDNNMPLRIEAIVVSTQHDDFMPSDKDTDDARAAAEEKMLDVIKQDVKNILIPRVMKQLPEKVQKLFNEQIKYHINPTGKFVIGGPHGDTGLTGRKIIVDTYGGKGAHGGGAFSGKDSSKVDRSAAYAARHMAKNLVAAGIADEILVQVAYAIGVARPVGLYIHTNGTCRVKGTDGKIISDGELAQRVQKLEQFDMRPAKIVERLGLKNPIFSSTAAYGHMGRKAETKTVSMTVNGKEVSKEVKLFSWEELNCVDVLRKEFGITEKVAEVV